MNTKTPTTTKASAELLRRSVPAQLWQLSSPPPMLRLTDMAPYRPSRREFLAGAAGLLVLAPYGCGEGGGAERDAPSGGTRTVRHEMGRARVPGDPKRVVVLDFFTLQVAVEIGVPVVGSTTLSSERTFPAVLTEEETRNITGVGADGVPNLESIATLEPDLILCTTFIEPPYDELSRIAPTVVFGEPWDWKPYFRSVGEATGRSDKIEEGLTKYEARVGDLRGGLRDVTVSHASLTGNETFDNYLAGQGAYGPFRILEGLGVERPPAEVTEEDTFSRTLSLEELPDLAGDVLIYNVGYPGGLDAASLEAAEGVVGGPLWQKIPAVRNGEAHRLDPEHWIGFGGLRSANLVLDDVEMHLT